jgi:putative sterol carrier protein
VSCHGRRNTPATVRISNPVPATRGARSLETATDQIRAQLPQLGALGYKVKFAINDTGAVSIDATATPPTLSNDDAEADCTIRLSEDRLEKLIDGRLSPTLAYTLGQIKIEGSLGVAMKLASLLEG